MVLREYIFKILEEENLGILTDRQFRLLNLMKQ